LELSQVLKFGPNFGCISLNCSRKYTPRGITSFPWKQCKSISFIDLALYIEDWKQILNKMEGCESLELNRFHLTRSKMRFNQFVNRTVTAKLKKLSINSTKLWIQDANLICTEKDRFPNLEQLTLKGDLPVDTVMLIIEESPVIRDPEFSLKCDSLGFTDTTVDESDILEEQENQMLQNIPDLRTLRASLSQDISNLKFDRLCEDEDGHCQSKLEKAAKIKELCHKLERFRYSPPGANRTGVEIDIRGFWAQKESIHMLESGGGSGRFILVCAMVWGDISLTMRT
jgi:hypothetical protein